MIRGGRSSLLVGILIGALATLAGTALVLELNGLAISDRDDPVADARELIEDNYFELPDERLLEEGSIDGMVSELRREFDDRFSHFFTPEELHQFNQSTNGEFSGIGLTVSEVARGLRVASVFADSPAERAGLTEGDLITEVDDRSIAGKPSSVSTARIKGEPGTEVEIRVIPADGSAPQELTVERAAVRVPAAEGRMRTVDGRKIAYVTFATFSRGSAAELRREIRRLYDQGAEGLVLDLRGNGGGLVDEAVLAGGIFVEDGTIVSTESRTAGEQVYEALGDALERKPTAVLVNRDTASAAEILAGALQYYSVGELVGTRTFGKGTFQQVIDLEGGGALDLTIGQYLPAGGESILGTGIQPDVEVRDDPKADGDEQLDRALELVGSELG